MKVSCLALVVALAATIPAAVFAQDNSGGNKLDSVTTNGEKVIVTDTPAADTATTTTAADVAACSSIGGTAADLSAVTADTEIGVATCSGSAAASGASVREAVAANAALSARLTAGGIAADRVVAVESGASGGIVVYTADAP